LIIKAEGGGGGGGFVSLRGVNSVRRAMQRERDEEEEEEKGTKGQTWPTIDPRTLRRRDLISF